MKKSEKGQKEFPLAAQEPATEYQIKCQTDISRLPFMSMKEVSQKGMPLKESEQLMFSKIYSDFHKA